MIGDLFFNDFNDLFELRLTNKQQGSKNCFAYVLA